MTVNANNKIESMNPGNGRMLKENGETVNIANILYESFDASRNGLKILDDGIEPTVNGRITLVPTVATGVKMQAQTLGLIINNLGPGTVHIAFGTNIATPTSFEIQEGGILSGINCEALSLYASTSASVVQWLGGVSNDIHSPVDIPT